MSDAPDFDAQDQAETFDEDTTLGSGDEVEGQVRTFVDPDEASMEDLPDLLDVTRADGDRDDDEALALDADEFDAEAINDDDLEDDDELDYRAATQEREDDIDGLGAEDGFDEDRLEAGGIDGLDDVQDAGVVEGGEDDVTDFQAGDVSDDNLKAMGYSEDRDGKTVARPER